MTHQKNFSEIVIKVHLIKSVGKWNKSTKIRVPIFDSPKSEPSRDAKKLVDGCCFSTD